jgi:hypothetical protein
MAAIEAEGLRRTYKTTTGVVRRRSLEIEAVRGIDFQDVKGLLGAELLIGAVYGALGYGVMRWFEYQSRRSATLERS